LTLRLASTHESLSAQKSFERLSVCILMLKEGLVINF